MLRKRVLDLMIMSAVVVATASVAFYVLAAGDTPQSTPKRLNDGPQATVSGGKHDAHTGEFEKCARACSDCERACGSCAKHCADLLSEGKKEHVTTLETCQDCADFCAAAAHVVSRRGPFSDAVCKACVEACDRCAKACAKSPDDAHMKACADECRRCEKACRTMVEHTHQ